MNVDMGHLCMFKIRQIPSSHSTNKQIMFKYATAPAATQTP